MEEEKSVTFLFSQDLIRPHRRILHQEIARGIGGVSGAPAVLYSDPEEEREGQRHESGEVHQRWRGDSLGLG